MRIAAWCVGLVLLMACGGGTTAPATEGEGSAGGEAEAESEVPPAGPPKQSAIELLGLNGPDKPWTEMDNQEREWYMIAKVHPIAHEIFRNYNAKRYEVFECAPCHGEDGKAKKYKMPSDHLGALPDPNSEDFKMILGSKLGKFMSEEVTPITAKILGMPPYDPKTGQGFNCFACHTKE